MVAVALSIAGSDPSGGAGIQADLKVFQAHGVYGQAVIALLTVQNTRGVQRVSAVDAGLIAEQIGAVIGDIAPAAIKTGALPGESAIRAVARALAGCGQPLVVDPVLSASVGASFGERAGLVRAFREVLLPLATLVTPNTDEAQALTGLRVEDVESAVRAGEALCDLGAAAALIKGGHLAGDPVDVLVVGGQTVPTTYAGSRIASRHTHGTGCALSAAITAELALGSPLHEAVSRARLWLRRALLGAPGLGSGCGPLDLSVPRLLAEPAP